MVGTQIQGRSKYRLRDHFVNQKKRFLVFQFWLPFRGPEMAPLFWPFDNNYLFWGPFLAPKMGAVFGPQNGAQGGGGKWVHVRNPCLRPGSICLPLGAFWAMSSFESVALGLLMVPTVIPHSFRKCALRLLDFNHDLAYFKIKDLCSTS